MEYKIVNSNKIQDRITNSNSSFSTAVSAMHDIEVAEDRYLSIVTGVKK